MNTLRLFGVLMVIIIAGSLVLAGCTTTQPSGPTVGLLNAKGTGAMPTLLATGQIDGYIAWQPFAEVAPVAHIGKVVTYSQNLPPASRWKNHPCCVLTAREDILAANPGIVDSLAVVTILSTQYLNTHPNESAELVADWLAGKGNFTYGNISVSSVEVLDRAFPTVKFTNEPSEDWQSGQLEFVYALRELKVMTGSLQNSTESQVRSLLFDTSVYGRAKQQIDAKQFTTPPAVQRQLGIGYLMSDHDASLFIAVKKWQYFNDTYGIALKPRDPTQSRPDLADLIVNGKTVATFKLVAGDAGPALMQLSSIDTVQFAYVGNPPAMAAIDKGTPVKILMALNTEGSGLVVSLNSPANDWDTFAQWAKDRAAAGKPLVIAVPSKGSIQDILLRYALEESNIGVKEV
ncbi:MAG: ABC transporter substrate-binding protein [Methanomicrobiales archaeon]|nr:ABC transporter substrate-binding protein [Methanomicrobiales archaeon]